MKENDSTHKLFELTVRCLCGESHIVTWSGKEGEFSPGDYIEALCPICSEHYDEETEHVVVFVKEDYDE